MICVNLYDMLFVGNLVCWNTTSLDGRDVGIAQNGRLLQLLWDALSKAGEAKHSQADLRTYDISGTWVEQWNMSLRNWCEGKGPAKAQRVQLSFRSSLTIPYWGQAQTLAMKKRNLDRGRGGSIRQHPKNKSSTGLKCIYKGETCRQHVDSMLTQYKSRTQYASCYQDIQTHSNRTTYTVI